MEHKFFSDKRLWLITLAIFILLMTVFDRNNLIDRWKIKRQIRELENQKEYYLNRIAEDSALIENLKDDEFLEKYARERYLFKKDDEQIYIVK